MPAPFAPPPTSSGHDRRAPVLFALALLVAIVALAVATIGWFRYRAGDAARRDAASIDTRTVASRERANELQQRVQEVRDTASELEDALVAVTDAANAVVESDNRLTAVIDAATGRVNAGDTAGARAMYENEVSAALADVEATTGQVQAAVASLQTALEHLRELVDD